MSASRGNDPLASFNFIITVDNMRAGFSEVGGLTNETDIVDYRDGNASSSVRKVPGMPQYTNISLKRGYTPDGRDLYAWRKAAMDGKTVRKGGTITLLNEAREPTLTWEFKKGWPSKWTGPTLNARSNEVAIEEMEICVEELTLQT